MTNYCNSMWPLIYDQYNHDRHEQELAFYSSALRGCSGPVLEVACGTGMILLPLLEQEFDIYGFDLSEQMLETLFAKAKRTGRKDIAQRVMKQNMVDFRYDFRLDAVFIPARSFLHLATQEDQIACLRNIRRHLHGGGRLMLNFFTPSLNALLRHVDPNPEFKDYGRYHHPESGEDIKVSFRQINDLSEQTQQITWQFEISGSVHESAMMMRWIYKKEFELLAKIAGFKVSALYSGFESTPYNGEGEMVWILEKDSPQQDAADTDNPRR